MVIESASPLNTSNAQGTSLNVSEPSSKQVSSGEEVPKKRASSTASAEMKGKDPIEGDTESGESHVQATLSNSQDSYNDGLRRKQPARTETSRTNGRGRIKRKRIEHNHRKKVGELFQTLSKVLGSSEGNALRLTRPLILEMAIERLSAKQENGALETNVKESIPSKRGRNSERSEAIICPSCGNFVGESKISASVKSSSHTMPQGLRSPTAIDGQSNVLAPPNSSSQAMFQRLRNSSETVGQSSIQGSGNSSSSPSLPADSTVYYPPRANTLNTHLPAPLYPSRQFPVTQVPCVLGDQDVPTIYRYDAYFRTQHPHPDQDAVKYRRKQ